MVIVLRYLFGLAALWTLSNVASGGPLVTLNMYASNVGGNLRYYAVASPQFFPGGNEFEFVSGRITSADNQYSTFTSNDAWYHETQFFNSFEPFIASLQQPFFLQFDEGLPTARSYTTTLNLDGISESTLATPAIHFPLNQSTIDTLDPTFQMTLPGVRGYYSDLQRMPQGPSGSGTFLNRTTLFGGTTEWDPPTNLSRREKYSLDFYANDSLLNLGFTTPIDSEGEPIPDWQSALLFDVRGSAIFYSAPEPTTWAMIALGGGILGLWQARAECSRWRPTCKSAEDCQTKGRVTES